ncbi:alpha/beta hydrolase [Sutcliffiella cohnii]|uniref:alpha/beta hydrolase n=1 Tax=Sutcliffiella cohnii TaxID=33932 RepID=UPI002E229BCA
MNSLETVCINGDKQWIYIRSKNENNPILLFLHGGPGAAQIYCVDNYFKDLEESFIVVDWDQRGSGKSYNSKISKEPLTINQYLEDTKVLAEMLMNRFNKNKIFLVGHSWGSIIGLLAVQKYPHLFQCYIGIGQVINLLEGEIIGYDYALKQSKLNNDISNRKKLEKIGSPPYPTLYKTAIFRNILDKYGGYKYQQKTSLWNDYLKEMIESKHYRLTDTFKWFRGTNYLVKSLRDEMLTINFKEQVTSVAVPVYFLAGKYDYITPTTLVEEYYEIIKSPAKKLIYFEKERHDLHFENSKKFMEICQEILFSFEDTKQSFI